jgi:hypothetical protein
MLLFKWFNFVLCLAALATAGLGECTFMFMLERCAKGVRHRYLWIWPLY